MKKRNVYFAKFIVTFFIIAFMAWVAVAIWIVKNSMP